MVDSAGQDSVSRLLVVMPTWVGDNVMATPALRALRERFPQAHITAAVRRWVRPIIEANPWTDRIISLTPRGSDGARDKRANRAAGGLFQLARRLRAGRLDTAILLTNSFRSAALVRLAGIPRRIGYSRDGRGWLLTDRATPVREAGKLKPMSALRYYLDLVDGLSGTGARGAADPTMQLFTRQADDREADCMLRDAGILPSINDAATAGDDSCHGKPLVLINPGANYGDAKMWLPQRFAAVSDRCVRELGAVAAVIGSPKEQGIRDEVIAAAEEPMVDLGARGLNLRLLKCIVKRSALMVTNDTGPRHIAAAFGKPVVTIFGPTDPAWSEIDFSLESQVRVDVPCGPCQLKQCPLAGQADEHQCMKRVSADMVFAEVQRAWSGRKHAQQQGATG